MERDASLNLFYFSSKLLFVSVLKCCRKRFSGTTEHLQNVVPVIYMLEKHLDTKEVLSLQVDCLAGLCAVVSYHLSQF